MADLDQRLNELAAMPVPALAHLEHQVLSRIHDLAEADRRMPRRLAMLASFVAVGLGIAGAGLPSGTAPAHAASLAGSLLAPSHLLMGEQ